MAVVTLRSGAWGILVAILAASPVLAAQDRKDYVAPEVRQQTFDLVWKTMRDEFYDPRLLGVDWQAVRRTYEARALETGDSLAFHRILSEMAHRLPVSHVGVNPPVALMELGEGSDVGIQTVFVRGKVLVESVRPGSSAATQGVQQGDEILAVDGESSRSIQRSRRHEDRSRTRQVQEALGSVRVLQRLLGKKGTSVRVKLQSPDGTVRELHLERSFDPSHHVLGKPEVKRLTPDVGYMRFKMWSLAAVLRMDEALKSDFAGTKGIILDLRSNIGGEAAAMRDMVARFMPNDGKIGRIRYRNGKVEDHIFHGNGYSAYSGNLVILVDSMTGSASEVFAAGMKTLKRAKVLGWQTPGSVLLSVIKTLPTGGTMIVPIAGYDTPDNRPLEGRGVTPSEPLSLTEEQVAKGVDGVLERAIQLASRSAK